jgi:hypothetical protein
LLSGVYQALWVLYQITPWVEAQLADPEIVTEHGEGIVSLCGRLGKNLDRRVVVQYPELRRLVGEAAESIFHVSPSTFNVIFSDFLYEKGTVQGVKIVREMHPSAVRAFAFETHTRLTNMIMDCLTECQDVRMGNLGSCSDGRGRG